MKAFKAYCVSCRGETFHTSKDTSHVFHCIMTILTGGFWAVIWACLYLRRKDKIRCNRCGCS